VNIYGFNGSLGTGVLNCLFFDFVRVLSLRWLGISVWDSVSALRRKTVSNIDDKLKRGSANVVISRAGYNMSAFAKFHSTFCDHDILFAPCLILRFEKAM